MSRETCTEKRAETRSGMNILHEMCPEMARAGPSQRRPAAADGVVREAVTRFRVEEELVPIEPVGGGGLEP